MAARRDERACRRPVSEEQRSSRSKASLPFPEGKGRALLGCNCVMRRLHSPAMLRSAFLVSLQNRPGQLGHYLC